MLRHFGYILSFLLVSQVVFAGEIKTSTFVEKPAVYSGLQIEVEDASYADESVNTSAYSVTRRALLHLSYTRDLHSDLEHKYWRYEIDYTEQISNSSGTLAIQFNGHDIDYQHIYEELAIFNTNSAHSSVMIKGVRAWSSNAPLDEDNLPTPNISNPAVSSVLPDDIKLTLSIETERYYNFALTATVPLYLNGFSSDQGIDLGWGYTNGAEEYELEWVFIDSEDLGVYSDPFEYKEPTSITTTKNTYRIDPMFPKGILYFRVRPKGKYYLGAWSYNSEASLPPLKQEISTSFEKNKNWQYSISFAEDGKSKKVLNYMDGSMRDKQTVTKLSTEDVYVVGVNRYDYEGRASVSILPSAIDKYSTDHNYSYKDNLNKASDGSLFNREHFDNNIGNLSLANKRISTTNGAGEYYSSDNPFTDAIGRDYIPDAQGMPYAQTEFLRDGTGRVKRSSGVGIDHALGSDHETFYFYSSPNTTELRRLFGENVGNVNHYKKNYVVDPNGQISASYLDQEGRTIATCLVGNSPDNLDELPGNSQETLVVNLNDANELVNDNGIVSRSESTVFNYFPQTYSFEYNLNAGVIATIINSNGSFCENCSYILEIKVLNPDGSLFNLAYNDPVFGVSTPTVIQKYTNDLAAVCPGTFYTPSAPMLTFDFQTTGSSPKGNYTVIKTLRVDESAMQAALDNELLSINNGQSDMVPSLQSLINAHMDAIDYSNCDITCEQHAEQVYLDQYNQTNNTNFTSVDDLYAHAMDQHGKSHKVVDAEIEDIEEILCDSESVVGGTSTSEPVNECETLLEILKEDVVPGGWLFESPWLESVLPGYSSSIPYSDRASLLANWDASYAGILVHSHREYCHYEKCLDVQLANAFANEMALINQFPNGTAYLDPSTNGDPILNLLNTTQQDAFKYLINFTYPNVSGLQQGLVAYTASNNQANYPGTTQTVSQVLYNGNYTDAKRWQLFQSLYNAERMKLIEAIYSNCVYYSDDYSINRDPYTAVVWTEDEDCVETCEGNVENWLTSITSNCNNLSAAHIASIKASLENYCASTCNGANSTAMLLEEDRTTNTDLINIQLVLDGVGCGNDSILEYMTATSPCSQIATTTMNVLTTDLTLAANHWKLFINDLLAQPYTEGSYITINSSRFPTSSSLITNHITASSVKVLANNSIELYNGNSLVATNNQFRCTYDDNADFIALSSFTSIDNLVTNPTYTDGSNYTFKFDGIWNNNGVPESLEIVKAAGCPDYYPSLSDDFSVVFDDQSVTSTTENITVTYCAAWNDDSDFDLGFDMDDVSDWCSGELEELAELGARAEHEDLVDAFIADYWAGVNDQCLKNPLEEHFKYDYQSLEYQYTLFYFDQAGSLVQTVPPEGVSLLSMSNFNAVGNWIVGSNPNHELKTTYKYNSLGQLLSQHTPDAGDSRYFYNDNQQLRFSQNAEQADHDNYSYTKYDEHGRTVEAGQVKLSQQPIVEDLNDNTYPTSLVEQVTASYYDEPTFSVVNFTNENTRGRITNVAYREDGIPSSSSFNHATHYSYDIHGNVQELVQENRNIKFSEQHIKRMTYGYDLISGNVNEVIYQKGELDEFRHRYTYDADNRLTIASTSKDGEIWKRDAKYFYYLHGPLARVEIGHDKVAANDFAYTIQGWLKGVNSTSVQANREIGKDGHNIAGNHNRFIGQDAFGFTLGYFGGDYSSIGTSEFLASNTNTLSPAINDLFNGNISHMTTGMKNTDEELLDIHGNSYRYDQLNRIKSMNVSTNSSELLSGNTWLGATASSDYHTKYEYDKNGNLQYLLRNAHTASGSNNMDDFTYIYGSGDSLNKLLRVEDGGDGIDYGDIRSGQTGDNYEYNKIGQLVIDHQENIKEIKWTVSGKVKEIIRGEVEGLNDVEFFYDAMGNRIGKLKKPRDSNGILEDELKWTYTHYVLDASGNTMAVYQEQYEEWENNVGITDGYSSITRLNEHPIYGSSRIGVQNVNKVVSVANFEDDEYATVGYFGNNGDYDNLLVNYKVIDPLTMNRLKYIAGEKSYELSNHLGNVLAVITDKKVGVENGSTNTLAYYQSDVVSYSDYYPFGMLQPNRHGGESYRYGMNGMEQDNEVKGNGNSYTTPFRQYDSRLGRWLSLDPITHHDFSPYSAFDNNPIYWADPSGANSENGGDPVKTHKNDEGQVITPNGYGANFADDWYSVVEGNLVMTNGTNYQVWNQETGLYEEGRAPKTVGGYMPGLYADRDDAQIGDTYHEYLNDPYGVVTTNGVFNADYRTLQYLGNDNWVELESFPLQHSAEELATWVFPIGGAAKGSTRMLRWLSKFHKGRRLISTAHKAKVGFTNSFNYRKTFFNAYPQITKSNVVVHHAVEQQVLKRYPKLFKVEEIQSLENLRGIPKSINSDIHLSKIRKAWNRFYKSNASPTRQQVLEKATEIDNLYGGQFTPKIR